MTQPPTPNTLILISRDPTNPANTSLQAFGLDVSATIQILNLQLEALRLQAAVDAVKRASDSMIEIPKMVLGGG